MPVTHMLRVAGLTAAGILVLSGCGDDGDAGEYGLVQEGTLTVCSDVPYPPFEFEDSDAPSGYSGFDMDLLQAIADNLDLDMTVEVVGFDPLQSGTVLASGQCDIGASAMTITEERKQNLDFSDPYYDSLQSLLVPTDSGVTSIDDVTGTIGVQQGTTGEAFANENLPEGATPEAYPSDAELWTALQAGNIDGILQDFPVNDEHAQADEGFEIVDTFETDEQYGFAFAKDEKTELLEAVNEQLSALREDGTYDEIYDRYFSVD